MESGDSGICISRDESLLLNDANGLRFFSAFLSKLIPGGTIMLLRRPITVPSRRRPPSGVDLAGASGTVKNQD